MINCSYTYFYFPLNVWYNRLLDENVVNIGNQITLEE